MKALHPEGWKPAKGYANGMAARGTTVFVAGQIGWDAEQRLVGEGFVAQARQALENIVAVLAEAGGGPEHIGRMTWYVTDKAEYVAVAKELGRAYRDVLGAHYPAMTLVEVRGLLEPGAKVEIEATAVVPD
ncbi:MAG: RidA family protein [Myxococcota bacterium]